MRCFPFQDGLWNCREHFVGISGSDVGSFRHITVDVGCSNTTCPTCTSWMACKICKYETRKSARTFNVPYIVSCEYNLHHCWNKNKNRICTWILILILVFNLVNLSDLKNIHLVIDSKHMLVRSRVYVCSGSCQDENYFPLEIFRKNIYYIFFFNVQFYTLVKSGSVTRDIFIVTLMISKQTAPVVNLRC